MIDFTTTPWGVLIPAHRQVSLAPKTRADAVRMASGLRMVADHLERIGASLPAEGHDDRHATPHILERVDGIARPTGVAMNGRIHPPIAG